MIRDRGIMGIFRQNSRTFFEGFGSLEGQIASFDSFGVHAKKVW
jgi:hypothetical protein